MNESRTPPSYCPVCRHLIDAATCVTDTTLQPTPGHPSICVYCGEIMVFADDLSLRSPTSEELSDLRRSPVWPTMQRAIEFVGQIHAKGKTVH